MAYKTWKEAILALEKVTGLITKRQQELGNLAGLTLTDDTPYIVAAAALQVAFRSDLYLPLPQYVKDWQWEQIDLFLKPTDFQFSPSNDVEAHALISFLRLVRRREKLQELKIVKGDIVKTIHDEIAEISSIGKDGRVYFKGGKGFSAWPDQIVIIARTNDSSEKARKARRQAANTATHRASTSEWSSAKRRELSEFIVEDYVRAENINELESVLDSAKDERPIQKFLEAHPFLLTSLLSGTVCFCLPQKRLGGEYIPDFIIGDADSLGIRWILVELETPRSGIYLKKGNKFDSKTQKGVDQVIEWRNWLSDNVSYARRRRSENGLGLFDIREKSKALVLVGRRNRVPKTKEAQRHEFRESNNIEIHTYDWLLESLRGILHHHGPTAMNPYLI